jgi:hypothetical protein
MLREGGKMMIAVTATTADGLAARTADTATANVTMAATVGIVTPTAAETVP